jgi:hypothetical protein
MREIPVLRHVYLTLPSPAEPTLNLVLNNTFSRYRMTRDQLFYINAQIADALLKGKIDPHDGDQLTMRFNEGAFDGPSN